MVDTLPQESTLASFRISKPIRPLLGIIEEDMALWRLTEIRPQLEELLEHIHRLHDLRLETRLDFVERWKNFFQTEVGFFGLSPMRPAHPGRIALEHLIDARVVIEALFPMSAEHIRAAEIHVRALLAMAPEKKEPPKALVG